MRSFFIALCLAVAGFASAASPSQLAFERAEACYLESLGELRGLKLAAQLYQDAADLGHAEAQVLVAQFYHLGEFLPQNDALACAYLQRAVDAGDAEAQLLMATLLMTGAWSVKPNLALAVSYLELAAHGGDTDAHYLLSRCYSKGMGVLSDEAQAVQHLRIAADAGQVSAALDLANRYQEGRGVQANAMKALRYNAIAAKVGDGEGLYRVAMAYRYPEQLVESGRKLAFERFEAAAMAGSAAACYELGICYLLAYGTAVDAERALECLMDASMLGDERGRIWTAMCLVVGMGCEASWTEAMWWLKNGGE